LRSQREERAGEDAKKDAAKLEDGFKRHGACLDSGRKQATAGGKEKSAGLWFPKYSLSKELSVTIHQFSPVYKKIDELIVKS